MQELETPSTAVAVRDETRDVARPLPPMNDAEVAAAYRTARAFAEGGLFKDAMKAGQAFTKILAGRDLGLTPFESMSGLHVIEGKIEAGSDLHATKVRQRDGYEYEVWWIKAAGDGNDLTAGAREAVAARDEDPTDLRVTVGCAIRFTVDGEQRGVSTWTIDDSKTAGLLRDRSNHQKFPRSMYFARSMTNGVAWYVPEVMGGLRVYGLGEVPREPDITDVDGEASDADIELPTAVEAIAARARTLGYAPLANRAAVAMAVGGQPDEFVAQWVSDRTQDLNRYAAGKALAEAPDADERPAYVQMESGKWEAIPGPDGPQLPIDAVIAEGGAAERIEALRDRALNLLAEADALDADGDERAGEVREEAEKLMDQVDAAQGPEQGRLGL